MAFAPSGFAAQNSGFALVIGNADYPDADAPLKDPVSDARRRRRRTSAPRVRLTIGENLKKQRCKSRSTSFLCQNHLQLARGDFLQRVGIQSDRQSYLIPVDAQIWNESDVQRDGFSLDKILAELTRHAAGR